MPNPLSTASAEQAADICHAGGLLAYPTEAVWGLGCDPHNELALERLLALKQRPVEKGLILIAADYSQLLPFVDDNKIIPQRRTAIFSAWPGPVTWLLPKRKQVSHLLSGQFDTIAVRVTQHPDVIALCRQFNGAITSTSANLTGQPPARAYKELDPYLLADIDGVLAGEVLGAERPSAIFHGSTGEPIRI